LLHDVDIEDKIWSLTRHLRNKPLKTRQVLFIILNTWQAMHGIQLFHEPEALEIHFLPEVNKLPGAQHFCTLLDLDPALVHITYAGDDEADVPLMYWILHHMGIVYTVGDAPLVQGSAVVANPKALAQEITKISAQAHCTQYQ